MNTNKPNSLDFKILKFVDAHGSVSEAEIIRKFGNEEITKLRIEYLSSSRTDPDRINSSYLEKGYQFNKGCAIYNGMISITPSGKKAIQDRKIFKRERFWNSDIRSYIALVISALSLILSFWVAVIK